MPLGRYNPTQIEESVSSLWKAQDVAKKTITNDPARPLFSFLEGPPTANAPPALHHVEMRTIKDLFCRFKYMQGFSVPRKGGWDCHGLPVEVQIEKKLGLKSKKDVLALGIGTFNKACREDVFTFINDWNLLTEKMAYWIDLENPYVTLENDYIESVWWSLSELHKKELLYESHKVVPYCPRCETPLSSHEVAQGYKDVTDRTITVKFKSGDAHFLAWTTTPWTVPANIALAVNPAIDYVTVEHDGQKYILAKEAAERYFENPRILSTQKGSELVGRDYEPVFGYYTNKLDKPAWKVIAADYVTTTEGTGIVHQAPAFGEDDYAAVQKAGLAFVQPVNESGHFTSETPDLEGLFVKKADAKIIEKLGSEGKIFSEEQYAHSYPHCWRCTTPLLYYAITSWFVRTTAMKDKLLENNEKINWFPETIKHGRFGDWLANLKDWALSRKKFWGTPLPIWRCSSGHDVVISSIEELRQRAISVPDELDLHKPMIDDITLKCECGKEMQRIPDVIDCWYDSGAAPFAQYHYPFENKEMFDKSFPYDFIAEAIDQTRGWFYTLHALGTLLFGQPAYKSVVCAGHVVDEKGEKMSKTKGNVIDPWQAFEKVGVDAVRLQFCSTTPGAQKRFGYEMIKENITPFLTILWNSASFAQNLAAPASRPALQLEDEWLISRLQSLAKTVTQNLEIHNYHLCIAAFKDFVENDLSKWYIKLIRDRAADGDLAVSYTLRESLNVTLRLLAPFAPYVTEHLWQQLRLGDGSIHLAAWPLPQAENVELEKHMVVVREIVQAILSVREQIQRGVRWPLASATLVTTDEHTRQAVRSLAPLIKSQTNLKKLTLTDRFDQAREVIALNGEKLHDDFGENATMLISSLVTQNPPLIYQRIEKDGHYSARVNGSSVILTKEHFIIRSEPPEHCTFTALSAARLYVDTEMSAELEAEGLEREFVRRVQQLRKNSGLSREQRIELVAVMDEELAIILSDVSEDAKKKMGLARLTITSERPQGEFANEEKSKIRQYQLELLF